MDYQTFFRIKTLWKLHLQGWSFFCFVKNYVKGRSLKNSSLQLYFAGPFYQPTWLSKDRLLHAAASSFALVVHLISRLLPMPLAVDDAQWPQGCFWAGDKARPRAPQSADWKDTETFPLDIGNKLCTRNDMSVFFLLGGCGYNTNYIWKKSTGQALTFETKCDLLRSLHALSRGFSAAASALSALHATREMDSARWVLLCNMGYCMILLDLYHRNFTFEYPNCPNMACHQF